MFFKSKVIALIVSVLVFLTGTLPLVNPVYAVSPSELDSNVYNATFQDFAPEAQGDGNLLRYNMGEIPPQIVWHGSSCEFLLHWDETTSASFDTSADPQPTGDLTLEPSTPPDWHFCYTPDLEDKRPFIVTITATSSDESVSQSFEITPMPKLAPEQTIFRTGQHTEPGPLDPRDVHISIVDIKIYYDKTNEDFCFNYNKPESEHPIEVRNVSIIGETVVFEEGQKAYDFNNDEDIKQMTIIGDKVIIRSRLNLPQTDIIIYARELRFEGKGQIKTAPINPPPHLAPVAGTPFAYKDNGWEQDSESGKPGGDGIDPPPSGSVTLYVKDVYPRQPSNIKLDLRGANGGNPVRGWPGTGSEWDHEELVKVHHEWVLWPCRDVWYWHPSEGYDWFSYVYLDCPAGTSRVRSGTITLPKDGLDAVPAGTPGLGGTGGSITATVELPRGIASLGGGMSGMPANGGSKYSGRYCNGPWNVEQLVIRTPWACVYQTISRTGRKTKCGASAPAPSAEKPSGDKGKIVWDKGHTYTWLHPLLLNRILNQAKNDYLGDRIEEAESAMKPYVSSLEAYREHQSWAELAETDAFELEQMYNEMQTLLHRIASGLDYYGNPPGWVPMLSFEVNKSAFEDEIGRAIRQLYLAYWIKNKAVSEQARVDALSDARERLREEMTRAKADYEVAAAKIPILYTTAQDLQNQTTELQYKLQEKEQELEKEARDKAIPGQMLWAAWTGARIGLKIGGMMCSMMPVGQPALGAVGSVSTLVSNFDYKKPWDTIIGGADVTSKFTNSLYTDASGDLQNKLKKIDTKTAEYKKTEYLGKLKDSTAALSAGLKDMGGFFTQLKVPQGEVDAQLKKLKSQSPEYKDLVEDIEELLEEKKDFAQELTATMQTVSSLSDSITHDILAIDAMNREIQEAEVVLDERATMYLDDMERSAYDRLLKFHYYMAKAYEYRLLKPYTTTMDFEDLIKKFEEIADLNSDHEITPDQFDAFKGVYEKVISDLVSEILKLYNMNLPEKSTYLRLELSAEEIECLNAGEPVTINLVEKMRSFFLGKENVRIVNIAVDVDNPQKPGLVSHPEGGNGYGAWAILSLHMKHSGLSKLISDGQIYQFRHYSERMGSPIEWGADYNATADIVDPVVPAAAMGSLLCSLIGTGELCNTEKVLLYSRPAAWADIILTKEVDTETGTDIIIDSLRLKFQYDFMRADPMDTGKIKLQVLTSESDLMPYFISSQPDLNSRQDGRGEFLRTFYRKPSDKVIVEAPAEYGAWQFEKWTDLQGKNLGEDPTNPILQITLDENQTVVAQMRQIVE